MGGMTLKEYRVKHGLTQTAIAERVGVNVASICRYENGRVPAHQVMRKILAETGGKVDLESFYFSDATPSEAA